MKNRIKVRRAELDMTQYELADKAGVARTIVNQIETGKRQNYTSETMEKIAIALECELSDIFMLE